PVAGGLRVRQGQPFEPDLGRASGGKAAAGGPSLIHPRPRGSNRMEDQLVIAGQTLRSRLILGTGKHRSMEDMVACMEAADVEMITVALRRIDFDNPHQKTILDYFDWSRYRILPNTAGCQTAEEAIRVARLARAM